MFFLCFSFPRLDNVWLPRLEVEKQKRRRCCQRANELLRSSAGKADSEPPVPAASGGQGAAGRAAGFAGGAAARPPCSPRRAPVAAEAGLGCAGPVRHQARQYFLWELY